MKLSKHISVAIDAGPLQRQDAVRGIGFHTKELVKHLQLIDGLQIDVVDFSIENLRKYDIVHYPYFHPHFLTLPFKKPAKKVVLTIHDLIRLIYPTAYPPGIKGRAKFLLQKFNLRNVDEIITISQTSKKDILRFLPVREEQVRAIYLAPQQSDGDVTTAALVKAKYDLPKKFILYVGDVNYNKNIRRLAQAIHKIDIPLVVVGKQAVVTKFDVNHPENKEWKLFLDEYGESKLIKRVGFVSSQDLPSFYKLATAYCQPSLYEGFGLPILEAFQYSCPVVASRTQALVEVGDDACLYADPFDATDIAEKLNKVINSKEVQEKLSQKGENRLKVFSWEKAALETYEVYKRLAQ